MFAEQTSTPSLASPVEELPGIGPAYVKRLARLGIATLQDLLLYVPRRHEDLRQVKTIETLQRFGGLPVGQPVTLKAEVLGVAGQRTRARKSLVKAQVGSRKGFVEAVWFNQPFLAQQLKPGDTYIFAGKLKESFGRLSLVSPAFEKVSDDQTHTARLVPVYPETEGLSSKWLRAKIKPLLPLAGRLPETLPLAFRRRYKLLGLAAAVRGSHFPSSLKEAAAARYRFDFEQLLVWQLATLQYRQAWQEKTKAPKIPYDPAVAKRFVAALPWPLTDDQLQAVHEVLTDLDSPAPMMRLLEGDVGSGKTVVAAMAAHQTVKAGFQVAFMSPTEVLARQHAATLAEWLAPLGVEVAVLLGSMTAAEKRRVQTTISQGSSGVVVGTQALISEGVSFPKLGLAIVDEQHRFGVAQREALRGRHTPHLLSMSATPIPRSLTLAAFGDQALSVIEQLPAGRRPVRTTLVRPAGRPVAYREIVAQLNQGRQAFVVYPVIEQSVRGLKDATNEFDRLRQTAFQGFTVGLLHGKLKAKEKERVMAEFVAGKIQVLVSTSVIEVGVDVPNATVMVIEEAQQFGLAQLHQFRGRVGRGAEQSWCYLLPGSVSAEENQRLQAMTTSDSGFQLAEIDLKLRGPGDLLGTKQSGFDVSLAAIMNPALVKRARSAASTILDRDPRLKNYPLLKEKCAGLALPA